jgi:hypothetical protein
VIGTAEEMRAAREAQARARAEQTERWFDAEMQRLIYGMAVSVVWPQWLRGDLVERCGPRFGWVRRELFKLLDAQGDLAFGDHVK